MNIDKRFNLASRHNKFNSLILEALTKQDDVSIENKATEEARKIHDWNHQVAACIQSSRAFIRLNISRHNIVYGKIEPEHYVEDLVAKWFLSRFPNFTIMIGSPRGTFVISKHKPLEIYKEKLHVILPKLEIENQINPLLEKLEDFNSDECWSRYYSSQFIQERKNKRLFLKNIKKKYHNWEGLRIEKQMFEGNKTLIEF